MDEAIPTVLADVEEGADLAVIAAGTQDGVAADFVGDVVAVIRYLFYPSRDLPDTWPEALPFLLEELLCVIAITADGSITQRRLRGLLSGDAAGIGDVAHDSPSFVWAQHTGRSTPEIFRPVHFASETSVAKPALVDLVRLRELGQGGVPRART